MKALLPTLLLAFTTLAQSRPGEFENGLPTDPEFFPIGVWLQSPHNASRYAELGINLYVGLWEGPTTAQLAALEAAKMRVICPQNEVGLQHDGKVIVGWMHGDEPDNAQRAALGYGPPVEPWKIVAGYEAMRKRDATRPVLLNLGQGAAWDAWHGRGTRTNHPEDYPEYLKGCDVGSFDIYPVTHDHAAVAGKLEFVGNGVRRMRRWSGNKPIFACIETGHVSHAEKRPTPAEIRSEVWMAVTCGARGVIYFAHEFAPKFVEAGIFQYPEVVNGLRETNAELRGFAKVLNGPTIDDAVTVRAEPESADIAVLCKRDGKSLVVFTTSLTNQPTAVTFELARRAKRQTIEVVGERRKLRLAGRRFNDTFEPYAVHHYRVPSW